MQGSARVRRPPAADPRYSPAKGRAGAIFFIVSETAFFLGLFMAWLYFAETSSAWPPLGIARPWLGLPILNSVIMGCSVAAITIANRAMARDRRPLFLGALVTASVLGLLFTAIQVVEFTSLGFGPSSHAFGSTFVVVLFFHVARVLAGVVFMGVVLLRALMGQLSSKQRVVVQACTWYWYFIAAVWYWVFYVLYLTWPV